MAQSGWAKSVPDRLGKYRIDAVLGSGAMGVVYKAHDPDINRTVAIKTIQDGAADADLTAEFHERFRYEAQAAGRLSHPNIVSVYDFGLFDGVHYLVMEYVDGPTLADSIRGVALSWSVERIVSIVSEVLSALGHAHKKGVIHRDIKPSNVLLSEDGRAKLADFGVAKLEEAGITRAGAIIGTPYYMAPEIIRGSRATVTSDLYSVGVVLYEILTGEKPFSGTTASAMQKIVNQNPIRPSLLNADCPDWLDAAVTKAIAKDPKERFQSAEEFSAALQQEGARPAAAVSDPDGDATIVQPAAGHVPNDQDTDSLGSGRGLSTFGGSGRRGGWSWWAGLTGTILAVGVAIFIAIQYIDGNGGVVSDSVEATPEEMAWTLASVRDTVEAYESFLDSHPSGMYAREARRRRDELRLEAESIRFDYALQSDRIAEMQSFLVDFPDGRLAAEARNFISGRVREHAQPLVDEARCAEFDVQVGRLGEVTLTLNIPKNAENQALRSDLRDLSGIQEVVTQNTLEPWPLCEAIALIERRTSALTARPEIRINSFDGVYLHGQMVSLQVKNGDTEGYLYVDYYDTEGDVVHLFPTIEHGDNTWVDAGETIILGQGFGQDEPNAPNYSAGPPYGPGLFTAFVTNVPVLEGLRSEEERARPYLDRIEEVIFGRVFQSGEVFFAGEYRLIRVDPRGD